MFKFALVNTDVIMSKLYKYARKIAVAAFLPAMLTAAADYPVELEGSLYGGVGSNDFAPFYMASNTRGKVTQSKNLLLDVMLSHKMDTTRRFSYSWGVEALGGVSSEVGYMRYNPETQRFGDIDRRPPAVWLQQLYGEVKWRSLFLSVGLKDEQSMIVDPVLSTGDICLSNNARPIAAARAGFIEYQNIPLTKGWVQISGCISFGMFTENNWIHDHFNYWAGKYCDNRLWAYKNIYFRTKPTKPFFVTIGMQNPGLWGGTTHQYGSGRLVESVKNGHGWSEFFSMLIPHENVNNREGHYVGDQKGSWDLKATYRFRDSSTLSAYFQWFWEDGSAMAKRNGMDGLWGLEYKRPGRGWINGAVFEYFDFTNMSGPLHYALQEHPDGVINVAAGGNDNYYNNWFYGPFSNYGMCIGNSLVMGSIYYRNGIYEMRTNRVRAFHIGITGSVGREVDWLIKFNYRTAYGRSQTYDLLHRRHATSFLAQADWKMSKVPGLTLTAQFAVDHGKLPQNACAGAVKVTYNTTLFSGK